MAADDDDYDDNNDSLRAILVVKSCCGVITRGISFLLAIKERVVVIFMKSCENH